MDRAIIRPVSFILPAAALLALLPAIMSAPARVAATVHQAQAEVEGW